MSGVKPQRAKREHKLFVRMNATELMAVTENAEKFCGGNLSKWLRDRGHKPMLDISIKMQDEVDKKNGNL